MSKDGHTFYYLWSEFSLLSLKANTGLLSLKALPSVKPVSKSAKKAWAFLNCSYSQIFFLKK